MAYAGYPLLEKVRPGQVICAMLKLAEEDLSQTCQRQYYCIVCCKAFCVHCCYGDHHFHIDSSLEIIHVAELPDTAGAGGRPALGAFSIKNGEKLHFWDELKEAIFAEDYVTPLPRDAFCLHCTTAFSAAACPDHHKHHHSYKEGLPEAILRIEEHGGRRCVRCTGTGSEWWLPYVDEVLGDPVHEDEHGELLPVLTSTPGMCKHCGGEYYGDTSLTCSDCSESYERDVAERRQRREARQAARRLAKLQIGETD